MKILTYLNQNKFLVVLPLIPLFFSSISLLTPSLTFANESEQCPNKHICVPEKMAARWYNILSHVQCMDNALDEFEEKATSEHLSLTFEDYRIIVTEDGQVFEQEEMITTLQWCEYEIEFHTKPNVQVYLQREDPNQGPFWGFRLRVRLGIAVWLLAPFDSDTDISSLTQPVILLEPFYIGPSHIAMYGGLSSFGVVAGFDLTRNLNIFSGVGATWRDAQLSPVVGLSLSFN